MKSIQRHICFGFILLILMGASPKKAYTDMLLKKIKYNYLLSLPDNYYKEPGKKWPVIFYLHGSKARGNNLKKLEQYGLPYYLSTGKKIDFIVISPQCPWGKDWSTDDWFNPVYDDVASKYRVDECRVYMMGMSLGGFGTWALANRMPDRFAAISPMCGGANIKWAENIKHIPTWIFHGTADTIIPVSRADEMAHALKKKNTNLRFSRLVQHGHDISVQFNNDALYAWFKQFSLKRVPFWEEPLPILRMINLKRLSIHPPFNIDISSMSAQSALSMKNR